MMCAENNSPAAVRSAVCGDGEDGREWAARFPAQEAEERDAQTWEHREQQETLGKSPQHEHAKLVRQVSPARTAGALAVCAGV